MQGLANFSLKGCRGSAATLQLGRGCVRDLDQACATASLTFTYRKGQSLQVLVYTAVCWQDLTSGGVTSINCFPRRKPVKSKKQLCLIEVNFVHV